MNNYGKFNKVLKLFGDMIFCVIMVYSLYVLCSPGLYFWLAIYLLFGVLYIYFRVKYKEYIKRKEESMGYIEFTEDRYASTYRKRFYNKAYLFSLIFTFIVASTYLTYTIYGQLDKDINEKFNESVEFIFGEYNFEDNDIPLVMRKLSPVLTNGTKLEFISAANVMEYMLDLSELLSTSDDITDDTVKEIVQDMEEIKDDLEYNSNMLIIESISLYICITLLYLSYRELKDYSKHRSIELKE